MSQLFHAREASVGRSGRSGRSATGTRLHGLPLAIARGACLAVALLAIGIFTVGLAPRAQAIVGADVTQRVAGQLLLSPWIDGPALRAGILDGDTLVAVDGVPVRAPHGRPLDAVIPAGLGLTPTTLDVRTGDGPVRRYAFDRYPMAVDVLVALIITAVFAVMVWRRSDEWPALVTALTLMVVFVGVGDSAIALYRSQPTWQPALDLWFAAALACCCIVLYLFPTGRFVPRGTRALGVILVLWAVAGALVHSLYPWYMERTMGLLLISAALATGIAAQVYRYWRYAGPVERQQTKWVAVGTPAGVVGMLTLIWHSAWPDQVSYYLSYSGVIYSASRLCLVAFPLSIGIAIVRYRLWEVDPIIRRALIYGPVVGLLTLVYGLAAVLLQALSQRLTGPQPALAIVAITLAIAALVTPLRRRVQDAVDRRFYREKVDARRAFATFARELRTLIELPELLQALVIRTTDLLHISHGTVYLRGPDGTFQVAAARNPPPDAAVARAPDPALLAHLRAGLALSRPADTIFPLVVPLVAPRAGDERAAGAPDLLGVLALGPRLSEQRYSRDDQALVAGLAEQAGTAIYVAQLVAEKRAEAARRAESERQLDAHRRSPAGRAEALAQALVARPEATLAKLHRLAQRAGEDPDAASLLRHLPVALAQRGAAPLSELAAGIHYLWSGQFTPEVLPVGLRTMVGQLDRLPVARWPGAVEALAVYRLSQQAMDVHVVPDITGLLPALRAYAQPSERENKLRPTHAPAAVDRPLVDLADALGDLAGTAEALDAYERVEAADDKLTYLASAVERLGRAQQRARRDLGGADRPIAQRIIETWLAIVTDAVSDLQTRAQIRCTLLTRRSWQSAVITLGLAVRNVGRGPALNLSIGGTAAPDYTVMDEPVPIARLAPGEEAQVEVRVQPHPVVQQDRLRAHFLIGYADPRGPEQVAHFADMVTLLAPGAAFQSIPNPYVVGAPLQSGSPLFVGRTDLLAFIQDHLAAAHRNNLVLIGQRRTGKTSLLKQLPAQLDDGYLPVYLDGQALGLDPGLPNFFLTLATAIADALENRGIVIEAPALRHFTDSPALTFEHRFLAHVRAAIGRRHLLILLDEFEELEAAVRRGTLETVVFGFVRHLIQHTENLSVIFCGTHRLEELAADYWHVLFNIALYRHVGFLEQAEALRLIQDPVASYDMRYDDLALEKIWRVTSGHPYFLQLFCHSLVNQHNRAGRSDVTVGDVNVALEEILAAGEAHVTYLWSESTPEEQMVLAALSRVLPLAGSASPAQVLAYLREGGASLDQRAVSVALQHLALRDILTAAADGDGGAGGTYGWKLGLVGLWVARYHPLGLVLEEMRQ